jgi:predicted DNA-binding transcriptional regulator AlpA
VNRLITKKQLRQLFGVSTSTIDRWVNAGKLPEPRRILGSPRWNYEEVVGLLKTERSRGFLARIEASEAESLRRQRIIWNPILTVTAVLKYLFPFLDI